MPICFLFFPVLCYRRTWLVVVFFTSPGSLLYHDLCKMNAKCQQRGHCSFPVWIQTSKWPSLLESLKRLAVSNCRYACLKKGSPGQPLVQLLTYVKQQNTRWNVCSRVSSVLTWMPHGLTHLLALSALVFLPAKWAVLQAAPCWKVGFLVVLLPADQHEDIMKRSIICFLFHYRIHWAWQNSSAREICRDYLCRSNSRANPLKLVVVL